MQKNHEIYTLCKVVAAQFTIVIVVKLLIKGLCWEKFDEKKTAILENSFNKDKSVGL